MNITISLILCIIGGVLYIAGGRSSDPLVERLSELGKWTFGIALAAWLFGH